MFDLKKRFSLTLLLIGVVLASTSLQAQELSANSKQEPVRHSFGDLQLNPNGASARCIEPARPDGRWRAVFVNPRGRILTPRKLIQLRVERRVNRLSKRGVVITHERRRTIRRNIRNRVMRKLGFRSLQTACNNLGESQKEIPDNTAPVESPGEQESNTCFNADLNGDQVVDVSDLMILLRNWDSSNPNPPAADINGDGVVNSSDLMILLNQWGPTTPCDNNGHQPNHEHVVLTPGQGFSGPTTAAPVGREGMPGYDAKAIARWDVVPYQTFSGEFEVGVVAFHINGIDRVEFSVDGGPVVPVYEMSLNPRTNVVEYVAKLDASLFQQAGQAEVRAVVYPKDAGKPRVLAGASGNGEHSLILYADPSGSVLANRKVRYVAPWGSNTSGDGTAGNPFATIRRAAQNIYVAQNGKSDNGLIYLMAGDHPWHSSTGWHVHPDTVDTWLTISAAPGVSRENVRIVGGSGDRLNASLTQIKGVTVVSNLYSSNNLNRPAKIWFNNSELVGAGSTDNQVFATQWTGGIYSTESMIRDVRNGFKGGALLERNVTLRNLGEDAFFNSPLIINAYVENIDTTGVSGGPHPDLVQYSNVRYNNIVYGLKALGVKSQGLFMRSISDTPSRDIAFVNILVEMDPNTYFNQILNSVDHLLIWHVTLANRLLRIDNDPDPNNNFQTMIRNGSIRNSVIYSIFQPQNFESHFQGDYTIDNNHFIQGATFGTNDTDGDPGFMDPATQQYGPSENSVLRDRVFSKIVPVDLYSTPLDHSAAIGAIQP